MTETLFVMMTAFAGLLFTDPFFGGSLTKHAIAKVPLLAMGYGVLAFHLLGRGLTDPRRLRAAAAEVVADWWPAIALALFITAGSVYARFGEGIKESFLSMGLGMLFLPLVALAVRSSSHSWGLMKALAGIYVLTVLGMLAVLASGAHVFHEEIFLAVPLGAYFICAPRFRWWKLIAGLVIMGGCVLSVKNTTFLLVLVTLVGCAFVWVLRLFRRGSSLGLVTGLFIGLPVVAGAVAAGLWAYLKYRDKLPTGNVAYRVEMYGIAWDRFLDSPVWGTLFTDSSVNYFSLYRVAVQARELPTHSDILDLLSHGGAIAAALWLLVVWRMLRILWDAARTLALSDGTQELRAWRWLYVLALVQVGAVVTYAVNPPLISPVHGFWIWGCAGVMWALHRALVAAPLPQALHLQPLQRKALLA